MATVSQGQLHEYLLGLPNTKLDFPFGESAAVYKVNLGDQDNPDWKMFAIIAEGSQPVRISLKCDPNLSEVLRQKYESVMPGYHLNKKHWNTIVASGQLDYDEIKDLIFHSYQLVAG